jgi:hypothetical protein
MHAARWRGVTQHWSQCRRHSTLELALIILRRVSNRRPTVWAGLLLLLFRLNLLLLDDGSRRAASL